jgi:hypothetical protein
MRINGLTIGLLACLSGVVDGRQDRDSTNQLIGEERTQISANEYIRFLPDAFTGENRILRSYNGDRPIEFQPDDDLRLDTVNMYALTGGSERGQLIAHGSPSVNTDTNMRLKTRQDTNTPRPFSFPVSETSLTLALMSSASLYEAYYNMPIYLEFQWTLEDVRNGMSYSPLFGFTDYMYRDVDPQDPAAAAQMEAAQAFQNLNATLTSESATGAPFLPEDTGSESDDEESDTTDPTGATTSGPTSTPDVAEAAPSSIGLSTGAAAGIGAGVGVAVLILLGLGIWFCLRRRRAAKNHGAGHVEYVTDAGTQHMMPNKEMSGVSDSSPHSAYGDDSARFHDRGSSGPGDDSYAPYSDHAAAAAAAAAASPAQAVATPRSLSSGGRSPTPPIADRYAHLVEEGMTEDEIKRLDEEERHLDAAIEEAGASGEARRK